MVEYLRRMNLLDGLKDSGSEDALRVRAAALGLELMESEQADREALPPWARIVRVRSRNEYALWDARRRAGAYTGQPRGVGKVNVDWNDRVVDIGAFVGSFSVLCARKGAHVDAYEPSPAAYRVLLRNALVEESISPWQRAVVADKSTETVTLHASWSGAGTSNSIVFPPRHANPIQVKTISYAEAVFGATIIKIDVEGYEYELPILPVAKSVRTMLISFHSRGKGYDWRGQADRIRAGLFAEGFKPIVDVDLHARSVFMHEGVYGR